MDPIHVQLWPIRTALETVNFSVNCCTATKRRRYQQKLCKQDPRRVVSYSADGQCQLAFTGRKRAVGCRLKNQLQRFVREIYERSLERISVCCDPARRRLSYGIKGAVVIA